MQTMQERMMNRFLYILNHAKAKGADIEPEQFAQEHFAIEAQRDIRGFDRWLRDMVNEIHRDA